MSKAHYAVLKLGFSLLIASIVAGQADDRLVGRWSADEGFQIVEYLFRSDGRYQVETRSTASDPEFMFSERGRYQVDGQELRLTPYDYLGEPQARRYQLRWINGSLEMTETEFGFSQVYPFVPDSKADVLAQEQVEPVLIRAWQRSITFYGESEYTFRPGGFYVIKSTPEGTEFPPEYIRGRYEQNGSSLVLTPYGGVAAEYELDFFGSALTLIRQDEFSGESMTYHEVPGSEALILAKAAEAAAFLEGENWQVGVWEVRDAVQTVDLTIRPDGYYLAENMTEFLEGPVRGRYTLEPGFISLEPFPGQGLYARSNGEFGKVPRMRAIDYYDGELQFIDLGAISQSVTLARKRPGSEAAIMEKVRLAQLERERAEWQVGRWEVQDPTGWMEFVFRPDGRYLAMSGVNGVAQEAERGRYFLGMERLTLAPYAGLARAFELDFYDGQWFLVGDPLRMVIARIIPGSETEVREKTVNPEAMLGDLGGVLGLWTAHLPGQSVELVFRDDGQFRLNRCENHRLSQDYGLYEVDMTARTMVYDSRFTEVQRYDLDFYGDTMTLHGGSMGPPRTYTVNRGSAEAAIEASYAADAVEGMVDAEWLERVPVILRDPDVQSTPVAGLPVDPNPLSVWDEATVFEGYQLYRRLMPGWVYFNDQGTIRSVAVVDTREWHFFPTGRVLVRFQNHRAGVYPLTVVDITDNWGAYHLGPKPTERDILNLYADNTVWIETDLGEIAQMTLEDGRRHLFWGKDYQILSSWASEQQPVPCEPASTVQWHLQNTGVSLATTIPPEMPSTVQLQIQRSTGGMVVIRGEAPAPVTLLLERAVSLVSPVDWHPVQTNDLPAGPFSLSVPTQDPGQSWFRVRTH